MKPLFSGVIAGKVTPYVRVQGRFAKPAKRYHASQRRIAYLMAMECCEADYGQRKIVEATHSLRREGVKDIFRLPPVDIPYRFGLRMTAPVVKSKSSPNYGQLPGNAGDYDNVVKAFLDAAQYAGVVAEDSLRWYRGPAPVVIDGELLASGVVAGVEWSYQWSFVDARLIE